MEKTSVIRCLLAVILTVYLGFALLISSDMAASARCTGYLISINGPDAHKGFVTAGEVTRLMKEWGLYTPQAPASKVDIRQIEERLNAEPNIEHATVERMPDNKILVQVTPMTPVARIFPSRGSSYYINRDGKTLTANSRYRLDVPVIAGDFDSLHPATDILPLINRLEGDKDWSAIISHYRVDPRNRDIILVPMIRGHVINLGDTTALESKLARVMAMYHKVLPLKGWEYYDTLSVKWGGQCVATRRDKVIPQSMILFDQEGEAEADDIDAMLVATDTDTVASSTPAYVN